MDYALVSILIFILWLAARKTKKLLKRLEPEEKLAQKTLIIIKADVNGQLNTHLAEPDPAAATTMQPAVVEEPEPAFQVEVVEMEDEAPAADAEPEWKEFTWESAEEEAVSLR